MKLGLPHLSLSKTNLPAIAFACRPSKVQILWFGRRETELHSTLLLLGAQTKTSGPCKKFWGPN